MTMNDFLRGRRQPEKPDLDQQNAVCLAAVERYVDQGMNIRDAFDLARAAHPAPPPAPVATPPGNAGAGNNKPPSLVRNMNQWIRRSSGR